MPELNYTILKNDTNLKAYYRFESGALTTDSSGNGVTLTNNNTVEEGTGVFGGSADFSGTKYLSVASAILSSIATWTISLWVKTGSTSQNVKSIFAIGNSGLGGVQLYQANATDNGAGANIIVNFGGVANFNTGFVFPDNTSWNHLVITRDGTTTRTYFNNKIGATSTQTPLAPSSAFAIAAKTDGSENWAGSVDDVAIFSTALSADQIKELYEGRYVGEGWPQAGLVALYHLNGNSTDFSGNNNHGTDTAITYSQANGKFGQGAGFNGSTSQIACGGTNLNLTGNWTIGAWIKRATASTESTYRFICAKLSTSWETFYLIINTTDANTNGKIHVGAYNASTATWEVASDKLVTDTNWHFICGIRNGVSGYIYFDGNLVATGAAVNGESGAGSFYIGRSAIAGSERRMNGAIDELSIFNVAKDAAWVRKQYALGVGKFY